MFDIGWSELVVIAVVALVVIGPKELPATLRTIGKMTARARKVAGEFRAQFDEAMREAELDDVRQTIADAQKLNPVNSLREAMNPLRDMGNEIKADLQRAATPDKAAPAATPLPSEPVPGVSSGLPEALAASSPPAAALSNPSPVAVPISEPVATAPAPQSVAAAGEAVEKPKAVRKPRAPAPAKTDEVAAAVVRTPVVTEKPKRAPRKVATAAAAVEKAPPAPRKRTTAAASPATPKTPKKKDQA